MKNTKGYREEVLCIHIILKESNLTCNPSSVIEKSDKLTIGKIYPIRFEVPLSRKWLKNRAATTFQR